MRVASKYLYKSATLNLMESYMGTITSGVYWTQLDSDISYELEKSLNEVNPKLNLLEREENKFNKSNYYLSKNGYLKHVHGYIEGKFIIISSQPKPFFNNLPDFKVTWHQSQWTSQREVAESFVRIFGVRNAYAILCLSRLYRSDYWLDCELPYERMKKSTFRPGVTVSDQRKSERKSYYLGSKGPKQLVLYEKPKDKVKVLDIKLKKNANSPNVTRIEARYFGQQVPIKTYADYINTANIDVFKVLKTSVFSKEKFLEAASKTRVDSNKIADFIDTVEKEGLHHARCKFNKNRNFYRTIEPILNEVSKDLNLYRRWKKKVTKEIVGDFSIRDYFKNLGVADV